MGRRQERSLAALGYTGAGQPLPAEFDGSEASCLFVDSPRRTYTVRCIPRGATGAALRAMLGEQMGGGILTDAVRVLIPGSRFRQLKNDDTTDDLAVGSTLALSFRTDGQRPSGV